MYHTPEGNRVLTGAEKRFFTESLGMMVDLLSDIDCGFGVNLFDNLPRNQKIAALHTVAHGLLLADEPAPRLTAAIEATVAGVYQHAREMLLQEIEDGSEESESNLLSWRELVLATASQCDNTDALPHPECDDPGEWDFLVDCLECEVLWDNDWEQEMGMDIAPERSSRVKEQLGIPDDYYIAVPSDPSDKQVTRLLHELRQLTSDGR